MALGFCPIDDWAYEGNGIVISDLKPKNVLKDIDGDLYVIDAEIKVKSNWFCRGCLSEGS